MTPTISHEKQHNIKNLISNNMKAIISVLPKNASPERAARMAYYGTNSSINHTPCDDDNPWLKFLKRCFRP